MVDRKTVSALNVRCQGRLEGGSEEYIAPGPGQGKEIELF